MGFPFPSGLKNIVLKFESDKIIVIPLAKTGIEIINKIDVIKIDQQNKFILFKFINLFFIKSIEIIKFIELIIEEIPLIWREKIIKLIEILFWLIRGGYIVQPVLILFIISIFKIINFKEGISNQNLKLFIRGKIKSGELIIKGINQFLVLPIIIGIVIKKIIINACNVIIE